MASSRRTEAAIIAKLIQAPRSMTATSSNCFALNPLPDRHRSPGVPKAANHHPEQDRHDERLDIRALEPGQFYNLKLRDAAAIRMLSDTRGNKFCQIMSSGVICPFGEGASLSRGTKTLRIWKVFTRPGRLGLVHFVFGRSREVISTNLRWRSAESDPRRFVSSLFFGGPASGNEGALSAQMPAERMVRTRAARCSKLNTPGSTYAARAATMKATIDQNTAKPPTAATSSGAFPPVSLIELLPEGF